MMPKSLNLYAELLPGSHTEIFSPIGVNVAYGFAICCNSSSLCNLPNTFSFDAGKIEVLIIIIASASIFCHLFTHVLLTTLKAIRSIISICIVVVFLMLQKYNLSLASGLQKFRNPSICPSCGICLAKEIHGLRSHFACFRNNVSIFTINC